MGKRARRSASKVAPCCGTFSAVHRHLHVLAERHGCLGGDDDPHDASFDTARLLALAFDALAADEAFSEHLNEFLGSAAFPLRVYYTRSGCVRVVSEDGATPPLAPSTTPSASRLAKSRGGSRSAVSALDAPVLELNELSSRTWLEQERMAALAASETLARFVLGDLVAAEEPNTAWSLRHPAGMLSFSQFLRGSAGANDLAFWIDAETFHRCTSPHLRLATMAWIRSAYLTDHAPMALSPAARQLVATHGRTRKGAGEHILLAELQAVSLQNLRTYWLQRYLQRDVAAPAASPDVGGKAEATATQHSLRPNVSGSQSLRLSARLQGRRQASAKDVGERRSARPRGTRAGAETPDLEGSMGARMGRVSSRLGFKQPPAQHPPKNNRTDAHTGNAVDGVRRPASKAVMSAKGGAAARPTSERLVQILRAEVKSGYPFLRFIESGECADASDCRAATARAGSVLLWREVSWFRRLPWDDLSLLEAASRGIFNRYLAGGAPMCVGFSGYAHEGGLSEMERLDPSARFDGPVAHAIKILCAAWCEYAASESRAWTQLATLRRPESREAHMGTASPMPADRRASRMSLAGSHSQTSCADSEGGGEPLKARCGTATIRAIATSADFSRRAEYLGVDRHKLERSLSDDDTDGEGNDRPVKSAKRRRQLHDALKMAERISDERGRDIADAYEQYGEAFMYVASERAFLNGDEFKRLADGRVIGPDGEIVQQDEKGRLLMTHEQRLMAALHAVLRNPTEAEHFETFARSAGFENELRLWYEIECLRQFPLDCDESGVRCEAIMRKFLILRAPNRVFVEDDESAAEVMNSLTADKSRAVPFMASLGRESSLLSVLSTFRKDSVADAPSSPLRASASKPQVRSAASAASTTNTDGAPQTAGPARGDLKRDGKGSAVRAVESATKAPVGAGEPRYIVDNADTVWTVATIAQLRAIQHSIFTRMARKYFPRYVTSEGYQARNEEGSADHVMADMKINASMAQRQKSVIWAHDAVKKGDRRQAAKARWSVVLHDVLMCIRTLRNPISGEHFKHFLKYRGLYSQNDVAFYQDALRYLRCHGKMTSLAHVRATNMMSLYFPTSPTGNETCLVDCEAPVVRALRDKPPGFFPKGLFRVARLQCVRAVIPYWRDYVEDITTNRRTGPGPPGLRFKDPNPEETKRMRAVAESIPAVAVPAPELASAVQELHKDQSRKARKKSTSTEMLLKDKLVVHFSLAAQGHKGRYQAMLDADESLLRQNEPPPDETKRGRGKGHKGGKGPSSRKPVGVAKTQPLQSHADGEDEDDADGPRSSPRRRRLEGFMQTVHEHEHENVAGHRAPRALQSHGGESFLPQIVVPAAAGARGGRPPVAETGERKLRLPGVAAAAPPAGQPRVSFGRIPHLKVV